MPSLDLFARLFVVLLVDALIQRMVRDESKHHSIVMVTHRIQGLLGFGTVAVLNAGRVVELDKPDVLLQDRGSQFAKLYRGIS